MSSMSRRCCPDLAAICSAASRSALCGVLLLFSS